MTLFDLTDNTPSRARTDLPPPIIQEHEGILVVRDDLLPGGTKRRAIHVFMDDHEEYVYASPAHGAAQMALAYTTRELNKRCTIFCAKRKTLHPNTQVAKDAGAMIQEVPNGYLTVVSARAREYCAQTGAKLLPFGLDSLPFIHALADVARQMDIDPTEVWSVTSSGVLSRALHLAWPYARFYGVRVGHPPVAMHCRIIFDAPEAFDKNAEHPPPFPSCANFDAKVWRFVKERASKGALFWNVSS